MDPKNTRILIIEDDQFLRDFYVELLQEEGYTVDVAGDGENGQRKLLEGGWNLILLDLVLPKKDGLTILRELHTQQPAKQNGAILVLTNLGNDAVINECFSLGATGYLIKSGLNPDQVLSEIHANLKPL